MAYLCQHGHVIQDSWKECPECYAELDVTEAAYALEFADAAKIAEFVLIAVTSGIIGNLAYDVLKNILNRLNDRKNNIIKKLQDTFDLTEYERLRKLVHPESNPRLEIDIGVEIKIRMQYNLAFVGVRKQTKILEDLADQRERNIERESTRSKLVESQELARFAEERFRMNDLYGAVQLVNKAIELEPSFVPLYLQRARYFALQGKKDKAIADLRQCFQADEKILFDVENRVNGGKLNEFSLMQSEFQTLVHEMKEKLNDQMELKTCFDTKL